MALFTDGPISTIEELAAQDSQLLDVASAEGIDITQKLALAQEATAIDLETALRRQGGRVRLWEVVVTPTLRLWHTYRTLEMVYSDLYYNQLNDRYAKKRDQFGERSRWAHDRLRMIGIGIAPRPVPRAATPQVLATQGAVPDGTYYVTMAWVNQAQEEGASTNPAVITTTASGFLVQPNAPAACSGGCPTGGIAGWNVYAGDGPDSMTRQNDAPLALDAVWTQTGAVTTGGSAPGQGQAPAFLRTLPRVIQRG
jgi:hypothetical protein